MKKFFTFIAAAATALASMATTYTGTLTVDIDGSAQDFPDKSITLNQVGNNYDLSILNFTMGEGMSIGNIVLTDIPATTNYYGVTAMAVNKNIQIEGTSEEDLGPMLGFVPINMVARFKGDYLLVDIDIYMAALGQNIHVTFTSDNAEALANELFQLPNSNFEEWHSFKAKSGIFGSQKTFNEPVNWHAFGSSTGQYAQTARDYPKCEKDNSRNSGEYCVKLTSGNAVVAVANGSISSGRFNAGAMSATDLSNNAFMNNSSTDTDPHGDLFYMEMPSKADGLNFWMKYTPKKATASGAMASISAIVFNGVYMQDPEINDYAANKAGHAQKRDITNTAWTEYTVPFDYETYAANNAEAKAILLTASTSATPGGGTAGDIVYLDDIQLIYEDVAISNITISGVELDEPFTFDADTHEYTLTYDGNAQSISDANFSVTTAGGVSGFVVKNVDDLGGGTFKVAIAVVRGDMAQCELYSININRVVSLQDAIVNQEVNAVNMKDELYVVDADEESMNSVIVTDGAGSWVEVMVSSLIDFNMLVDAPAIAAGSAFGMLSDLDTNPVLTLKATPTPDYEAEQFSDFATYDLSQRMAPAPNEVAYVQGYMDANGKLRGYSGENGLQGQSLDLNLDRYAGDTNFVKGQHMSFFGIFKLKNAWSGAPRRVAADDPLYFNNLTFVVTDGEEIGVETGVVDINSEAEVVNTRYYNVAGQQVATPVKGVNIVVTTRADGTVTTTKVLK